VGGGGGGEGGGLKLHYRDAGDLADAALEVLQLRWHDECSCDGMMSAGRWRVAWCGPQSRCVDEASMRRVRQKSAGKEGGG
jgi:hypothetical protein